MIRLLLAVIAGKMTEFFIRTFTQSGASAAPGLVALFIDPQLISKLSKHIPNNIVITGTNGKTTTSNMIAHILLQNDIRIIRNGTGSNLSRGIASSLINQSSWTGKLSNAQIGVWEADEAAFVDIVSQIKPKHIILLNLFRDQLDRYGEINTILEKWKKTLEKATWKKALYINGDDGHLEAFKSNTATEIQTFGILKTPIDFEKKSNNTHFDIKAQILSSDINTTEIVFGHKGFGKKILLPIVGIYNIYNFLAAYLIVDEFKISPEKVVDSLISFKPVFGRMEKIQMRNWNGLIALIKNPMGTTQVLETIKPMIRKSDILVIMLNDNIADGTDVSWIWDAQFEKISQDFFEIYVTGSRRFDMALRLVYAGINKSSIQVTNTINMTITKIIENPKGGRVFILPTYTALLELQEYLKKNNYKNMYWHNEQKI